MYARFMTSSPNLDQRKRPLRSGRSTSASSRRKGSLPAICSSIATPISSCRSRSGKRRRSVTPDPLAAPEITFGFLGSDYDMRAMVAAIRLARDIAAQPAMQPSAVEGVAPGPCVASETELADFVRLEDTGRVMVTWQHWGLHRHRKRPARMGRNPATGEAIKIKASKKIAFRAANELKEAV